MHRRRWRQRDTYLVLLLSHWKVAAQEVISAALAHTQDDGASEMLTWLGGYLTGKQLLKKWYQLRWYTPKTMESARYSLG